MKPPAAVAYIAPFAVFIALRWLPFPPELLAPVRVVLVAGAVAVFSRGAIPRRLRFPAGSVALGAARSSLAAHLKSNAFFMATRVLESAILVPVIEELFWRGWLMRWVIRADFESVPMGQYTALSFWSVAVLFASEHGPYWDVGLITGVIYNWWMLRTRNLWDCILMHAVTNGALAAYVVVGGHWQYWL